jgi:lipoate-protein ligase A
MRYLDLTLSTAAENLALDEALLEEAEASATPIETLRFWEPRQTAAVVGRSSQVDAELRVEVCRQMRIPILRRISGGAAVLTGPGCLMYSLVLSYERNPGLRLVSHAHRFVLGTMAEALSPLAPGVQCRGASDLAVGEWKFSGNSARCRRRHLLYHGTLLYDFPLPMIELCLSMPPRVPDYRGNRPHTLFVANLPLEAEAIRQALSSAWDAREPYGDWPRQHTAQLVREKYSRADWNGCENATDEQR